MKRKFMLAKAIGLISFMLLILLAMDFVYTPSDFSGTNIGTMHTYLVKIPASAGVCPYAIMTMTKGKLKVLRDSRCICPYADNSSYMTARCRDIKSVISLLPIKLRNQIQVIIIKEIHSKIPTKST